MYPYRHYRRALHGTSISLGNHSWFKILGRSNLEEITVWIIPSRSSFLAAFIDVWLTNLMALSTLWLWQSSRTYVFLQQFDFLLCVEQGGAKWGGFLKKNGISILPGDQKLIHIMKKQALNFFYSRLISSGATIEMKKSKICSKSDFLYCFPLINILENAYCRAKK